MRWWPRPVSACPQVGCTADTARREGCGMSHRLSIQQTPCKDYMDPISRSDAFHTHTPAQKRLALHLPWSDWLNALGTSHLPWVRHWYTSSSKLNLYEEF